MIILFNIHHIEFTIKNKSKKPSDCNILSLSSITFLEWTQGCLKKQQKINGLEEEIISLKAKLRYQERMAKEDTGTYETVNIA